MLLTYNDFKNIISESLKKIINNGNENEIDIIRIFNLNDIPIDEIRYQYRDLSFTVSSPLNCDFIGLVFFHTTDKILLCLLEDLQLHNVL